jgi:uncharacterized protein
MAFRKLAAMLVREGFHVLRFDYFGTGDSAGGRREGSVLEWRQNIAEAATDLEECSGVTRVSFVGLRLGATLAAMAAVDTANLVLWRPVVNGGTYLGELRDEHERQFSELLFPPALPVRGHGGELLGFPLSEEMEAEIDAIDLLGRTEWRTEHIVLVVDERRSDYVTLRDSLGSAAVTGRPTLEWHQVPDEPRSERPDGMLLSTHVLQVIATALSARSA